MNIALKQLKVFVTVAQEKTITAAAEKLFLSKPAVSMALSELEKQLDHKLFDRNNNRLIINEQGKRLLPLADELLARSNAIENLFDQLFVRGRDLCRHIEATTEVPTYYYQYRVGGESKAAELTRRCPSCGGEWRVPEALHGLFHFKCDRCRIVSNMSWNFQ